VNAMLCSGDGLLFDPPAGSTVRVFSWRNDYVLVSQL